MACKDPSITFLNQFGYNVVRLPRTGIEPLDVIGKDDTTEWLGPLATVWKSTSPVPVPGAPQIAGSVQGQKSDKLNLSIGLKILGNALQAFGAAVPGLDAVFQNASKVQFTFTNVTSTSISPLEVGNFLGSGDLNSKNPTVRHYFLDENDTGAQAYLIFDVLKSDTVNVSAVDDQGTGIKLDIPAIQGVVGANIGVSTADQASTVISFKGPASVTFGFKAMEINYSNGSWTLEGAQADGGLAFGVGGGAVVAQPVLLRSGFVRI